MAEMLTEQCVHHWLLAVPEDEIVRAHCKRCGAKRDYPASVEGASLSCAAASIPLRLPSPDRSY